MFFYLCFVYVVFFFFNQKTAYELRISDWSSDVCSSDLFTAIAIVPLELIRTKVMIAIRIRGMDCPPMVSANTSAALGQGNVAEVRIVMYAVRKQEKMNVSLSRNIHVIALPQWVWRKPS